MILNLLAIDRFGWAIRAPGQNPSIPVNLPNRLRKGGWTSSPKGYWAKGFDPQPCPYQRSSTTICWAERKPTMEGVQRRVLGKVTMWKEKTPKVFLPIAKASKNPKKINATLQQMHFDKENHNFAIKSTHFKTEMQEQRENVGAKNQRWNQNSSQGQQEITMTRDSLRQTGTRQ